MTHGPTLYRNLRPEDFESDLRVAALAKAADRVVTLGTDTPSKLDRALELRVKWVVMPDRRVRVVPKFIGVMEISHAFLANGLAVLAAGEAEIIPNGDGTYYGALITRHSGHYQPQPEALALAAGIFAQHGIVFPPEAQDPTVEDDVATQ